MDLRKIGAHMKAARRRQNLSQTALASTLGHESRDDLGHRVRTHCRNRVRKLAALCEARGLELTLQPRRSRPTLDDIREERRKERARY